MASCSSSGHSGGWWRGGRIVAPETPVLDVTAAAAAAADDDDSTGDDPDEEGGDWLGNRNLAEYRAAWQRRGETDTIRSVGSTAAGAVARTGLSSVTGPDAALCATSVRSAAAGDVVVQVGDLLPLPSSLNSSRAV
jgi:hypothetical protein